MRARFKILPITIFVAAMLITIKIGDHWLEFDPEIEGGIGAALQAQQAPGDRPTNVLDEAAEEEIEAEGLLGDGGGEPLLPDSSDLSRSELDVLQDLRARRRALEARAAEIDLREKLVKAAEHNLESRISDWKRLKEAVDGLLAQYDEKKENDLQTLATYYEKMKPKDAARVFNTLEMTYLIDIVQRMRDAKVADIIGKMNTATASSLTVELARRRSFPEATRDSMM